DAIRYRSAFGGAPYRTGTWVTRAHSTPTGLIITLSNGRQVECDFLCTGYGLVPSTELARLAGCETRNGAVVVNECQETSVAGIYCAGEPTGIAGVDGALTDGAIAGRAAVGITSK